MILQLKQAQQMARVSETNILTRADHGSLDICDSLVNDMLIASAKSVPVDELAHHNTPVLANALPIEDTLPSNGNMGNAHRDLELANQISLADHHLNWIWDIVAEKSFQYSHVIRVSPCKAVTTCLRAVIKKLNLQIGAHCRMYS